jgi:hypothetical protein
MIAGGLLVAILFFSHFFSSGSVDRLFPGKWTTDSGGLRIDYDIRRSGSYTARVSVDEHGQARFDHQVVYLQPAGAAERPANWQLVNDSTVVSALTPGILWAFIGTIASAAGNMQVMQQIGLVAAHAEWKKTGAPQTGTTRWEFDPIIGGQLWKLTFDVGPGSQYSFHAEADDAGTFRARQGRWTFITGTQAVLNGTYEQIDSDTVSMAAPFGKALWKRSS